MLTDVHLMGIKHVFFQEGSILKVLVSGFFFRGSLLLSGLISAFHTWSIFNVNTQDNLLKIFEHFQLNPPETTIWEIIIFISGRLEVTNWKHTSPLDYGEDKGHISAHQVQKLNGFLK